MSDDAARDPATDDTVYADSAAPPRDASRSTSFREPETDDDLERGLAYAAARRRLLGELGHEIKRTRVGENHPDVALVDYNLSLIDINTGNPEQARATLERVRDVWDKRLPETHPWRPIVVMSMGTAARHAGDLEEALALVTKARADLHERFGDRPHLLVATADAEYALTLVAVGRTDEAIKAAGAAVAGLEKSVGPFNAAASVGLFALGEVARAQG